MQELINEKTFQNFIRIFDVSCEKRWNIFLEQNDAGHLRQAVLLALLRVVDLHDADPVLVAALRNHLDNWKELFFFDKIDLWKFQNLAIIILTSMIFKEINELAFLNKLSK